MLQILNFPGVVIQFHKGLKLCSATCNNNYFKYKVSIIPLFHAIYCLVYMVISDSNMIF